MAWRCSSVDRRQLAARGRARARTDTHTHCFGTIAAPYSVARVCTRVMLAYVLQFDMCPTFINKKELRVVFNESLGSGKGEVLSYPGFVDALARTALVSLSKPSFEHLYPSAKEKVSVLLEMWGVGDPRRLEEVLAARQP